MVMCADLPITAKPVPRLVIKGPHTTDERTTMSRGGLLIINRTPDDGLAIGHVYLPAAAWRRQAVPQAGEGYGDIRITGWMTIIAIDEFNALAEVNFACDTIESGDFLEPFTELVLPTSAPEPSKPDFSDRANLIFGTDNRVIFADGDVASIDRGTVNGVVAGQRYAIYRDFHNGLPLVYMGDAVVMSVNEQTSKVVVTSGAGCDWARDIAVPRRQPNSPHHRSSSPSPTSPFRSRRLFRRG